MEKTLNKVKVVCVENKYRNTNFTKDKIYEISKRSNMITITTNYISLEFDNDIDISDEFKFATCIFKTIKD